jgi:uncharacterized protein YndB with AHSA1/START domain
MQQDDTRQELVVRKTIHLEADSLKVWDALTTPSLTKKYFFGCEVHSEWLSGSNITWTGTMDSEPIEIKGKILDIEPGRLVRYTAWSKNSGLADIPSNHTIVTAVINDNTSGCDLSITDENFGSDPGAEKRYQDSVKGWDMVLKGLKELVER